MSLHAQRTRLVEALAGQGQVYDHLPARISPPAVVVLPGSPYVLPGDRAGHVQVHHTVSVISPTGANDVVTEALDDAIEDALVALVNAGVLVDSVSTFYAFDVGNASFLAADLFVHTTTRL